MVRRGYVQVAVDALGTGASEGGWELFGEDEQAGFANMDVDNAVTFNTEYSGNAGLSRTYVSAHAIDSDQQRSRILKGEMIQPYHYLTQEKARLLSPGEIVKMQIEIFPTSAVIRKGNKLRVAISPSNQAQGILNCPRQERAAGGITTIHNSPQYPFSVVLPIVPMAALN